ncbi:MAG: DUF302 domain-containing protein [Rhodospirillaceae bacterium]|jgi:uncharacterized protein (DUF302 family)|nr:DUF302 domain-containing protein [Rhodospirillaceae bacterium]MBT4220341.1 DUF302 domain-containing protein [Rhodospirillaceae bacterium]MBT4463690.1 DUF302 domain-containing protein [Rhodospirillaceae bacterium]MBT5013873.1 DUF302 domain-containing protein [Rhodospirillaceae bacterium]MBT5307698.1 DUF302 domain-containing protein [Rhodospirillaceae bacterium]
MSYHFTTTVDQSFDDAIETVTAALKDKGFGVLTTIDVQKAMKEKIDKDINPYTILGSCNPGYAYKAIQAENKIGTMLPCNVVVQQADDGTIEVSAVDPMASMQAIENPDLGGIAGEVRAMLQEVIAGL